MLHEMSDSSELTVLDGPIYTVWLVTNRDSPVKSITVLNCLHPYRYIVVMIYYNMAIV